jgi:WD40 repeat protein
LLALARDIDGVNGAVDLLDTAMENSAPRSSESNSPGCRLPSLVCCDSAPTAALWRSEERPRAGTFCCATRPMERCAPIFSRSDPLACAWHPAGRIFAAGCADGTVRVWILPRR